MGITYASDSDSLRCLCQAIVTHRKASALLAKSPILVLGARGTVKNPALQVQRDSAAQIRAFAQEFGLTPSSRTGVQTKLADDDLNNPFGPPVLRRRQPVLTNPS